MVEVKRHRLKTWPAVFERVISGRKTADFRRDDRRFSVGDELELAEWNPQNEEFTGRSTLRTVTDIATGFGIPDGYVMLSMCPPEGTAAQDVMTFAAGYLLREGIELVRSGHAMIEGGLSRREGRCRVLTGVALQEGAAVMARSCPTAAVRAMLVALKSRR